MGLRDAVASQLGVDENVAAAVAAGEHTRLDPVQRAAVELADAFLVDPAAVDGDTWAGIASRLPPGTAAGLLLRLTKFSRNKVRVSLGADFDGPRAEPVPYVPAARAPDTDSGASTGTLPR